MRRAESSFSPEEWMRWGWIVEAAAVRYGVPIWRVLGRDRDHVVSQARHEAMTNLWASGLSLPVIGRMMGRDHTTVLAAVRKVVA